MLTKPAGVALQLLSVPFLFGGCMMISSGFGPAGHVSSGIIGVVLMVAGSALLVLGRKPASRR